MIHPNKATGLGEDTKVYWSAYAPDPLKPWNQQFEWVNREWHDGPGVPRADKINIVVREFPFRPYDRTRKKDVAHQALDRVGRWNYQLAHAADAQLDRADLWAKDNPGVGGAIRRVLSLRGERPDRAAEPLKGAESFKRFVHPFVNASVSYTPYMYAKAEFGKLWDTGKMDYALERAIDGAAGLNWGEFTAGVSDTVNAFLHKPLADPKREKEAQRRTVIDTSQSVATNREVKSGDGDHGLSWRERMIQGKPEESLELAANKRKSYAEKEELRDLLAKSVPPTNSIN